MSKRSLLPLIIAAVLAIALLIVALVLITEQSKRLLPQSPDLSASSEASVSSSASSKPAESSSVPESETDQSEAPSESSSEAESTSETESASEDESTSEPESRPEESSSEPETSSDTSADSGSSAAESSQQEQSSRQEQSSSQSSAPSTDAATFSSGFTYPDKVPESPAVDNTWFDDALFIGDSITEGIKAYNLMTNTTVISNVGISLFNIATKECINTGDGTRITIPQAIKQYPNKTKIYIMLGVNGLDGVALDQFKELYSNFIDIVRSSHPNATIYIVSMFPINEKKFYNNGYSRNITNAKIDEFNHGIMEMCKAKGVNFLYVAECIKEADGSLSADVSGDGMHIGPNYYERWFKYMREHTVQ